MARIDRLGWSDTEFEAWLERRFPSGLRRTCPEKWREAEFDAPLQPVVGVSWFEASAYCRWLSATSSRSYRLPIEQEYEAASAGRERCAYAYGSSFDPKACNVFATRIWHPTPIGLFRQGTPEGIYDLTGNAWSWTSSMDPPSKDRPHDARRMVARGGSYDTSAEFARTFCRDSNHPGYRDPCVGFRLAQDRAGL